MTSKSPHFPGPSFPLLLAPSPTACISHWDERQHPGRQKLLGIFFFKLPFSIPLRMSHSSNFSRSFWVWICSFKILAQPLQESAPAPRVFAFWSSACRLPFLQKRKNPSANRALRKDARRAPQGHCSARSGTRTALHCGKGRNAPSSGSITQASSLPANTHITFWFADGSLGNFNALQSGPQGNL